MRFPRLSALAGLTAILMAAACEKQEVATKKEVSYDSASYELAGQVFAIQKNRINVKLGDVPLYYVDGPTFDARLSWISENLNKARAVYDYSERLGLIEQTAADRRVRDLDHESQEVFRSMTLFAEAARQRVVGAPVVLEMLAMNEAAGMNYADGQENTEFDVDSWFVSSMFGKWLEEKAYSVSGTDADGQFRIKVPTGSRGYLLAGSSREIFESRKEIYYWIYEVNGTVTTPVLLTTNNLLDAQQIGVFADQFRGATQYTEDMLVAENGLMNVHWVGDVQKILSDVDTMKQEIGANRQRITELRSKIEELNYEAGR